MLERDADREAEARAAWASWRAEEQVGEEEALVIRPSKSCQYLRMQFLKGVSKCSVQ